METFHNFNLNEKLLATLEKIGYKTPTEIQQLAIPKILEKLDIIATAQTGTGKTAAFMLPIIHQLAENPSKTKCPQVLVLVPTRELAIQVADEAVKFTKNFPHLKTVCVYGGVAYPIQRKALAARYDILVATPGRLIDHMEQGRIDLSGVQTLVLDEADRMLDMGFHRDVEHIAQSCSKERQTLMFSATIDRKVLPFSRKLQNNPFEIRAQTVKTQQSNIEQQLYYVDNLDHKTRLLDHILETVEMHQTIVFTATKHHADQLAQDLEEKGHLSGALHGDMNQRQRTRTIEKMHRGKIRVLVATDVAARGIDIALLSHVINFDLPQNPEDFIHRIGRTGRAGANGVAITFATFREKQMLSRINALLNVPMAAQSIQGLEPKPQESSSRPRNKKRASNGAPPKRSFSGPKRRRQAPAFQRLRKKFK